MRSIRQIAVSGQRSAVGRIAISRKRSAVSGQQEGRSRDREIAPTVSSQRSAVSGQQSAVSRKEGVAIGRSLLQLAVGGQRSVGSCLKRDNPLNPPYQGDRIQEFSELGIGHRESGLETPPTKRNPSHKSLGTSLDISTVVGNGTTLVIIPVVSNRSTS